MIDQMATLLIQPQDSASQRAQVQTALQQGLGRLQTAETRLGDVRSSIGIRLNAIDDALNVAAAQSEHATAAAGDLRDPDYAEAIGLSAAADDHAAGGAAGLYESAGAVAVRLPALNGRRRLSERAVISDCCRPERGLAGLAPAARGLQYVTVTVMVSV